MNENSTLLSLVATGSKVSIKPGVFREIFDAWQSLKKKTDCPKSKRQPLTLALHRIHSARMIRRTFTPDKKIIEAVNRREIFDFPTINDIRLRLHAKALKFIGEQFDIIEEKHDGDYYIVRIKEAAEYKIVNYIIVEGGNAKLLSHPELGKEVINRAEKIIEVQEEK